MGWFLSMDQIACTDCRNNRRRLDRCANHDPARLGSISGPLSVCSCRQIDRRAVQLLPYADLTNLFHDAHDRVPVALFIDFSELESCANRGASREVAIRKRFVDDRRRRLRTAGPIFQRSGLRAVARRWSEVVASHYPK